MGDGTLINSSLKKNAEVNITIRSGEASIAVAKMDKYGDYVGFQELGDFNWRDPDGIVAALRAAFPSLRRSNPARKTAARRRNPGTGRTIPGPSVKVMVERLRIGKTDAQHLKDMMVMGAPRILQMADSMMNGHGVERIPGRPGLMYVNMGDTYDTTLVYDYKTNRFVVSSWGDIVERQPRRFPD
jgi:hypothetical protein